MTITKDDAERLMREAYELGRLAGIHAEREKHPPILPIDPEAEAMVDRLMAERRSKQGSRKI